MSWNGGKGYLICLLSDTDTETLKKLAKCKYYIRVDETSYPSDEATGNGQNISPSSSPLSSDQGTGKTRREGKSLKHDLPLRVVFAHTVCLKILPACLRLTGAGNGPIFPLTFNTPLLPRITDRRP